MADPSQDTSTKVEQKTEPRRYESFLAWDRAEALRVREQDREFQNERSLRAADTYVKGVLEFRSRAIDYSIDYAKLCINSNFLLNGGSILALLSFIGSIFGKGDVKAILFASYLSANLQEAFVFYSCGLISTVLCAAVAYLNWLFVYQSWMNEGELMLWQSGLPPMPDQETKDFDLHINFTMWISIILGIAATVFFALGCFSVLQAFTALDFLRWFRV